MALSQREGFLRSIEPLVERDSGTPMRRVGLAWLTRNSFDPEVIITARSGSNRIGSLGLPGGKAEFGESIVQATARELQEETGCILQGAKLMGIMEIEWSSHQHLTHVTFIAGTEPLQRPVNREPQKASFVGWANVRMLHQDPKTYLPLYILLETLKNWNSFGQLPFYLSVWINQKDITWGLKDRLAELIQIGGPQDPEARQRPPALMSLDPVPSKSFLESRKPQSQKSSTKRWAGVDIAPLSDSFNKALTVTDEIMTPKRYS